MAKLVFKKASELQPRWLLPTGSYAMNRALGGGLESGRMHVFWGPKASTKSTTALYCIANAQRMGKTCLYVDAEKTFDERYAVKCGVDVDELLLANEGANIAEDLLTSLLPELDKGNIDVVVIDSLSSILQASFFEKPEANPMGIYSRSAKFVLAKILNSLSREMQVILISHASVDLSGYKPTVSAAMGSAQAHWTSNIIGFKANNGKDNFRDDGYRKVMWKFDKTKQPVWPFDGEYYFNGISADIDQSTEIFDTAVLNDVIVKAGAWYKFNDQSFRGADLTDKLRNDLDFRDEIIAAIDAYDLEFRTPKTVEGLEIEVEDA